MEFLDDILNRKTPFSILWYYGNQDDKIHTTKKIDDEDATEDCIKEIDDEDATEEIDDIDAKKITDIDAKKIADVDVNQLFEFVQLHKDVLDFKQWLILFKGFVVILSFKTDLMLKENKLLYNEYKKSSKITVTEYLNKIFFTEYFKNFDKEIESKIYSFPSPILVPIQELPKSIAKERINKSLLIRDELNFDDQNELDVTIENINAELQNDGFGGIISSANARVDKDDYFEILNEDQINIEQSDQATSRPGTPIPMDLDYDLQDLSNSPISTSADRNQSVMPSIDLSTINQPSNLLDSREEFLIENRRSDLQSGSGLLDVTERIESIDSSPTLTLELPPLDEESLKRCKRKKKKERIIDKITRFSQKNYFKKLQKYHDKIAARRLTSYWHIPSVTLEDGFKMLFVPNSIEPVTDYFKIRPIRNTESIVRELSYLETVNRNIEDELNRAKRRVTFVDDVVNVEDETRRGIKRKSTLDDDQSNQLRSLEFDDDDYEFNQGDVTLTTDNQIDRIVYNVLNEIVDRVSYELDESQLRGRTSLRPEYSSIYSEPEMHRDASAQYYSSFEPMMIHSDTGFEPLIDDISNVNLPKQINVQHESSNESYQIADDNSNVLFVSADDNSNVLFVSADDNLIDDISNENLPKDSETGFEPLIDDISNVNLPKKSNVQHESSNESYRTADESSGVLFVTARECSNEDRNFQFESLNEEEYNIPNESLPKDSDTINTFNNRHSNDKYIQTINDKLENNDKITFTELANNCNRKEAATFFFKLLIMKKNQDIEMTQLDGIDFKEITIKKNNSNNEDDSI